ncbi:hypothetical protein GALMADRAFT_252893 [Galerina marginata CBS 339.88]|uniref:Uncharacterized protein n=1 Tax=Galerina marginata (strain CBS 339.88) TaxID=685588 RepID=A0A067SRL9_GALM3|nr:hypothetical protein GALMADRAFT_252893 [Galerina marginata CBS 339.88]
MPIQTRSAARKAQAFDAITCVEKVVYVRTAQYATGEGTQIRWEHDEAPGTTKTEGEEAEAGTAGIDCTGASALGAAYSYSSLFGGSLSSISSSGSSDLSDSSFGSTFPDNSSNGADQSLFDTYLALVMAPCLPHQEGGPQVQSALSAPLMGGPPGHSKAHRSNTGEGTFQESSCPQTRTTCSIPLLAENLQHLLTPRLFSKESWRKWRNREKNSWQPWEKPMKRTRIWIAMLGKLMFPEESCQHLLKRLLWAQLERKSLKTPSTLLQ